MSVISIVRPSLCTLALVGVLSGQILSGQNQAKVDFARDVQPIFRQSCVPCHGPTQQISGMRLDRRCGPTHWPMRSNSRH